MRKHFLLLFLLTLLPLAGWAADPVAYKDVTVTVDWTTRAYNGNAATELPTVTVTGKTGSETTAITIPSSNYTLVWKDPSNATFTQASAIKNAGTYTVTVKAKNSVATFDLADGESLTKEFKITKVATPLTVRALNPTMTYGGTEPILTDFYEVTNASSVLVAGETLDENATTGIGYPVSLPTIDKVNAGTKNFTLVAREYTNYEISVSQPNGTLTIAQKAITVTTNNLADITYGTAKPTKDKISVASYTSNLVKGDVLTGELDYDFKVVKNAAGTDVTETLVEDNILPAGTYNVYPKGLSNSNYAITFAPGKLVVKQKTMTAELIADITAATYNGKNQKPTLKITDGSEENNLVKAADYEVAWTFLAADAASGTTPSAVTSTATDAFKAAGTYTATITAPTTSNYKITATGAKFTKTYKINKAILNVKTLNESREYDGTTTTLSTASATYVKYIDLANADASNSSNFTGLTLSLGAGAEAESVVGRDADVYPIIVSGQLPSALAANYTPEFGNIGKLTINKRKITITPNPIKKNYGAKDSYDKGVVATGQATDANDKTEGKFQLGGTLATHESFTTLPTLTRDAGEDAKKYTLTPSAAVITNNGGTTGDDATATADDFDATKNYEISYKPSTFEIVAGGFKIYAEDKESVFGKDIVELTYVVDGIPSYDAKKIKFGKDAITTTATKTSKRGEYLITIDKELIDFSAISSLYDISKVSVLPGTYTIKPAPLKIKAADQAHLVGDNVTAASLENIEFVTEGVSNADKELVINKIKLAFYKGETTSAADVPVDGTNKLSTDAASNGYDGSAAVNSGNGVGVWVGGIVIDPSAYNALTDANYTLKGTDAEAKAGTLYVTVSTPSDYTLDINATSTEQITAVAGKIQKVKLSNSTNDDTKRTLFANEWNAIVLPFDITPYKFIEAIGTYAIFDVMQTSGTAMNFKITINKIPAYTPFLVKVDKDVDLSTKSFGNVIVKAIDDTALAPANDAYIFQGNLTKHTPVPAWLITANSGKGSIDLYHNVTGGTNYACKAFSAYIKAKPATTEAPVIYIEEADGSTTAITAINADGVAVKADGWYTLNGIKLNAAPTEKGIYINNGKKVVVK